jgi:hypothetical protein
MSPKVYTYAVETVNEIERPDFGPNYNSLTLKQGLEDEIAEKCESVLEILNRNSEYTITNHAWINTNWWALVEDMQKLYADLIEQLIYKPNRTTHVNYVGDLIRMFKLIRDWCEENNLSRELLEENKVLRQDIYLILL